MRLCECSGVRRAVASALLDHASHTPYRILVLKRFCMYGDGNDRTRPHLVREWSRLLAPSNAKMIHSSSTLSRLSAEESVVQVSGFRASALAQKERWDRCSAACNAAIAHASFLIDLIRVVGVPRDHGHAIYMADSGVLHLWERMTQNAAGVLTLCMAVINGIRAITFHDVIVCILSAAEDLLPSLPPPVPSRYDPQVYTSYGQWLVDRANWRLLQDGRRLHQMREYLSNYAIRTVCTDCMAFFVNPTVR